MGFHFQNTAFPHDVCVDVLSRWSLILFCCFIPAETLVCWIKKWVKLFSFKLPQNVISDNNVAFLSRRSNCYTFIDWEMQKCGKILLISTPDNQSSASQTALRFIDLFIIWVLSCVAGDTRGFFKESRWLWKSNNTASESWLNFCFGWSYEIRVRTECKIVLSFVQRQFV